MILLSYRRGNLLTGVQLSCEREFKRMLSTPPQLERLAHASLFSLHLH